MKFLNDLLAIIGLCTIVALGLLVLTLERPTPKCAATVQQCGYGMTCGKPRCYNP